MFGAREAPSLIWKLWSSDGASLNLGSRPAPKCGGALALVPVHLQAQLWPGRGVLEAELPCAR